MFKHSISPAAIARAYFYALFLFVPLFYCGCFFRPYMAKAHAGFLLAGLALFFALLESPGAPPDPEGRRVPLKYLPLAGFAVIWVVSAVFSSFPLTALCALKELLVYLFLFLIALRFSRGADMFRAAHLISAAVLVVAAVSVFEFSAGKNITGLLGNKNVVVSFLIIALPLVAASAFRGFSAGGRRAEGVFSVSVLATGLFCVALARSRAGTAGFAVTAAAFGLILAFMLSRKAGRIALAVIVLGLIGLYFSGLWKILPGLIVNDVRFFIWRGAWDAFAARPLLGHGPGTFFIVYPEFRPSEYFLNCRAADITFHAHSAYLQILAECGAAGLIAFLSVIVGAFAALRRSFRAAADNNARVMLAAMGCGMGGLLLHNAFDPNLSLSGGIAALMWIFLGLFYGGAGSGGVRPVGTGGFARRNIGRAALFAAVFGLVFYFLSFRPLAGDFFFRKAVMAKYYGRNAAAARNFDRALDFAPWEPEYYFRKGFFLASTGRMRESILTYEQLSHFCPDYSDLNLNLGILYLGAGDPASALGRLERQLRLNPYDLKARRVMMDAHRMSFSSSASLRRERAMLRLYGAIAGGAEKKES